MPSGTWICLLAAAATFPAARADVVTDANAKAAEVVYSAKLPHGGHRVRAMAIVQVAVFEAVNAITGKDPNTRVKLASAPGASIPAAVAAASRGALASLVPVKAEAIEANYREALAAVPEGAAKAEGIALGERAAAAVLALRADDGWNAPETWRPVTTPGQYCSTALPIMTQWGKRRPWLMTRGDQFRPPPPPSLASATWARDYNEIKALGAKDSAVRSADQTAAARFWDANGLYEPIVRSALVASGRNPAFSARVLATAAIALDDAFIAVQDAKWTYNLWRPVTAIRNGDQDGNDATERDAGWLPFIDTPMHPEYPCSHCNSASAVATVLEAAFAGGPPPRLSGSSPNLPGVTRSWSTPAEMVAEVSMARIWDGVHYRNSTEVGAAMGRKIGQLAVSRELHLAVNP